MIMHGSGEVDRSQVDQKLGKRGPGSVVLRAPRDIPYKTVCVEAVEDDRELSWKACGILWFLISRPHAWKLYQDDLVRRHTDGVTGVRSGLIELEKAGYLRREVTRADGRISGRTWLVSERPLDEQGWVQLFEKMSSEINGNS